MQRIVVWARFGGANPTHETHATFRLFAAHPTMSTSTGPTRSRVSLPFAWFPLSSLKSWTAWKPRNIADPFQKSAVNKHNQTFPKTTKLASLQSTRIRSGSARRPSFFVYSLFFCFWPGRYGLRPKLATAWTHWQLTLVNPDITLFKQHSPIASFQQDPPSVSTSHTGPATSAEFLCFCFLFCFFTQSGTTDTDLPPDGPENHILNRRARGNLTTRYLQQTRVSRIFQPQFLSKNGPAPWKPSFSVYYFVSLPFPIFLTV